MQWGRWRACISDYLIFAKKNSYLFIDVPVLRYYHLSLFDGSAGVPLKMWLSTMHFIWILLMIEIANIQHIAYWFLSHSWSTTKAKFILTHHCYVDRSAQLRWCYSLLVLDVMRFWRNILNLSATLNVPFFP